MEVVNMHAFICCSYFALKSLSFSLASFVVPNIPFDPIGFELKKISIRKYLDYYGLNVLSNLGYLLKEI